MIRLGRLVKSFTYAFKGLWKTFHEEQNLKIQLMTAIAVFLLAWYFRVSRFEWIALVALSGLVILVELVNSAVERVADVLKPRINSYVKEIKDIMAAAVMIASITAIIVGSLIFLPRIFNLI